jgi:hypothetical protein
MNGQFGHARASDMDLRRNKCLFVRILVFASDMSLEIIKARPPFASRTITRIRARSTDITYLVADSRRSAVD